MNVSDEGRAPERYQGPFMSWNAFRLIGQQPTLGRDFRDDDDRPGAQPVAILGGSIWKSRYGADAAILGRTIKVNDVPPTVIGVMPEGMKFPVNSGSLAAARAAPQLTTQKRRALRRPSAASPTASRASRRRPS